MTFASIFFIIVCSLVLFCY